MATTNAAATAAPNLAHRVEEAFDAIPASLTLALP